MHNFVYHVKTKFNICSLNLEPKMHINTLLFLKEFYLQKYLESNL